MPRNNASKRKTKKARRGKRTRRARVPLPLGGFSSSKVVKLRYVQQSTLDAPSNSYSHQTFLANGLNYIYQPNSGSPTRHDPANFLRNMESYGNYCVLGSQCKVTFITDGTSNLIPSFCGIYLAREQVNEFKNIISGGINKMYEQPRNVRFRRVFGPSQSSNGMTISMNFSGSKFFNVTRTNYRDEPDFQGTVVYDPATAAYFQPFTCSVNGNNPGKVVAIIQIDYIVRLTNRTVMGN
jgi:hypothetical protein